MTALAGRYRPTPKKALHRVRSARATTEERRAAREMLRAAFGVRRRPRAIKPAPSEPVDADEPPPAQCRFCSADLTRGPKCPACGTSHPADSFVRLQPPGDSSRSACVPAKMR